MIPKASQRGGGTQLATHLLNAVENEQIELDHIRGSIADDLHGAFSEWEASASGTNCRKYLYSLSINPDPRQGPLTRAQYADFIRRTEHALGLQDQPRALVFHIKRGREHCHVIWSRINTDLMKAVHISHDRQKLRTVAREFARDHGLELPHGMQRDTGKDRFKARETLAEKHQQERTGMTKEQRRREITGLWMFTIQGDSFVCALEKNGYVLARGDRRAYVIVDRSGEIHSLARQIDGIKTRHLTERLAGHPLEKLPAATKIQRDIRSQEKIRLREHFRQQADRRKADLAAEHAKRRDLLNTRKSDMRALHAKERQGLAAAHAAINRARAEERKARQPLGLLGFLGRVTGVSKVIEHKHDKADQAIKSTQRKEIAALHARQMREARELKRLYAALRRVEVRERRSLKTGIRREIMEAERALHRPQPARTQELPRAVEKARATAHEITAPEKPRFSEKFRQALKDREERKEAIRERGQERTIDKPKRGDRTR